MKKLILLFIILLSPSISFAQKITEDETDKFTGNTVKRTSWEELCNENNMLKSSFNAYFRISKINQFYYVDIKLALDYVFAIDDKEVFLLKLENDEIIKLSNPKYAISNRGDALIKGMKHMHLGNKQGVKISFPINKDDLHQLISNKLVTLRIYTTDGYIDKDIKEKNYTKLKKSIELID